MQDSNFITAEFILATLLVEDYENDAEDKTFNASVSHLTHDPSILISESVSEHTKLQSGNMFRSSSFQTKPRNIEKHNTPKLVKNTGKQFDFSMNHMDSFKIDEQSKKLDTDKDARDVKTNLFSHQSNTINIVKDADLFNDAFDDDLFNDAIKTIDSSQYANDDKMMTDNVFGMEDDQNIPSSNRPLFDYDSPIQNSRNVVQNFTSKISNPSKMNSKNYQESKHQLGSIRKEKEMMTTLVTLQSNTNNQLSNNTLQTHIKQAVQNQDYITPIKTQKYLFGNAIKRAFIESPTTTSYNLSGSINRNQMLNNPSIERQSGFQESILHQSKTRQHHHDYRGESCDDDDLLVIPASPSSKPFKRHLSFMLKSTVTQHYDERMEDVDEIDNDELVIDDDLSIIDPTPPPTKVFFCFCF